MFGVSDIVGYLQCCACFILVKHVKFHLLLTKFQYNVSIAYPGKSYPGKFESRFHTLRRRRSIRVFDCKFVNLDIICLPQISCMYIVIPT